MGYGRAAALGTAIVELLHHARGGAEASRVDPEAGPVLTHMRGRLRAVVAGEAP